MKQNTKFVGYIRVSTARQAATNLSLQSQAAWIRDWAMGQGVELLGIHEDVGSAHEDDNLIRRVGLQEAIAQANREGANLVVVRLDRLSRNTADVGPILASFHGSVYAIEEGKLVSSPRRNRAIMAAIEAAQEEADIIAQTTGDALQDLRKRGRNLGSPKDMTAAVRASARVRRTNAEVAIERIADVLAEAPVHESMTARALADLLNQRGIRTGAGRKWTVAALRRPLRDAKDLLAARAEMANLPSDFMFDDPGASRSEHEGAPLDKPQIAFENIARTVPRPVASEDADDAIRTRSATFGLF